MRCIVQAPTPCALLHHDCLGRAISLARAAFRAQIWTCDLEFTTFILNGQAKRAHFCTRSASGAKIGIDANGHGRLLDIEHDYRLRRHLFHHCCTHHVMLVLVQLLINLHQVPGKQCLAPGIARTGYRSLEGSCPSCIQRKTSWRRIPPKNRMPCSTRV
jgi:hypothetical protein